MQHEMGLTSIEVCFVGKPGLYMLVNYHQQSFWEH